MMYLHIIMYSWDLGLEWQGRLCKETKLVSLLFRNITKVSIPNSEILGKGGWWCTCSHAVTQSSKFSYRWGWMPLFPLNEILWYKPLVHAQPTFLRIKFYCIHLKISAYLCVLSWQYSTFLSLKQVYSKLVSCSAYTYSGIGTPY